MHFAHNAWHNTISHIRTSKQRINYHSPQQTTLFVCSQATWHIFSVHSIWYIHFSLQNHQIQPKNWNSFICDTLPQNSRIISLLPTEKDKCNQEKVPRKKRESTWQVIMVIRHKISAKDRARYSNILSFKATLKPYIR